MTLEAEHFASPYFSDRRAKVFLTFSHTNKYSLNFDVFVYPNYFSEYHYAFYINSYFQSSLMFKYRDHNLNWK